MQRGTHDLAIEKVLLDHNNVHCLGVLEGQKSEASRPASSTISHHGALYNLSELREVLAVILPSGLVKSCSASRSCVRSRKGNIRSVVSQLRPPMNIFHGVRHVSIHRITDQKKQKQCATAEALIMKRHPKLEKNKEKKNKGRAQQVRRR